MLIDERDTFLAGRIQQIRSRGKVLAISVPDIWKIIENLNLPDNELTSKLPTLSLEPPKDLAESLASIPLFLFGALGYMALNGEIAQIRRRQ